MLEHLKEYLKGKTVILGVGNRLRSDDGIGSLLAERIKDKTPCIVYDAGASPENYLGKIIKDKPDNIIIIDAVDFGAKPGELNIIEGKDVETVNLFSTHNASIALTINYLQSNIKTDIIILAIQPKDISFGDSLSPEIVKALDKLESWFGETEKEELK
jgi:hydrogenase 3 maturation protease